jgi:hypothetical protein
MFKASHPDAVARTTGSRNRISKRCSVCSILYFLRGPANSKVVLTEVEKVLQANPPVETTFTMSGNSQFLPANQEFVIDTVFANSTRSSPL